jgi:uncharacterized repeat protein (TIGR01451 family)
VLAPDVQVVRFSGPPGMVIEVLGPQPEPVPVGNGHGLATYGLRVGTAYQLRVSNLPERPGAVLFPMIELVGHLHRPPGIDPAKYPIRVPISLEDIDDVLTRGRLVTEVVYLEDPELALPLSLPKDEIPVVTLSPAEDPLKVAPALGRVVAVLRIGGRAPTPEDLSGAPFFPLGAARCPFTLPESGPCRLPCGLVRGVAPPAGRPWLPKDEFLCDGGDGAEPAHFGGEGGLRGIDPRDAVLQFRDDRRPRILPTNRVCIYAPRFAAVRGGVGPNEATIVEVLRGLEQTEREVTHQARQTARRMAQNQAPEIHRGRARPSGLIARQATIHHIEVRVLNEADAVTHIAGHVLTQGPETQANRQKLASAEGRVFLQGVKSAESAVVTGLVQGAGEQVMAWKPQELAGVEVPPNKPGMAVVKQVSAAEALPGDVVTYTITYRNMGNVPITSVSIVDSLLPRLEYVPGSAKGPPGAVFTAAENRVGSMELRWDIGTVPPGVQGAVSFEAKVR